MHDAIHIMYECVTIHTHMQKMTRQSLSEGDAGTGVDEGCDAVSWSGTCSKAARFVLRASFSLSMPSTCS